jgi:hypothetical protein
MFQPYAYARFAAAAAGVLLAASNCQSPAANQDDIETRGQALVEVAQTSSLKPSSDVVKTNVSGVGDSTNLFRNIDDGTTFGSSDDSATYVRCTSTTCTHRVGYSGGPGGTVSKVVINYRVRRAGATGNAQVKLHDGSTLVATGPVRATAETWTNFTDTYSGLSLSNVNNLRTEMVMKRTSGTGTLRHTLVWIDATVDSVPPTVALTAPAAGSTVRGAVVVSANASDDTGVSRVDFEVDGVVRGSDSSSPYRLTWKAFHETFGSHPQGAHRLAAVAHDGSGNSSRSEITLFVLPAFSGDCNQDGLVSSSDVDAIGSEIGDGDGSNPESTPGGSFRGNPACDANEDNRVDAADQSCAQTIISQGPGSCFGGDAALVVPLVFVPTDRTGFFQDSSIRDFVRYKVEEARRFYARNNNGKTWRASPLEVVFAEQDHDFYWTGGNLEFNILLELQNRGYPVHVDWARVPSNRVTWVLSMGGGGWAGGRHYPTGGGFSLWGDALLFAGMDLDCSRVQPATPDDDIVATCQGWKDSGLIYGFGIGAAIHELGHGFNLPHPPDGSPDWEITVMGHHWNYPRTGLSDLDRSILAVSHYYPGFSDPTPPTVTLVNPTAGATVRGDVFIHSGAQDNYGVRAMRLFIDGAEVPGLPTHVPFDGDWGAVGLDHTWSTAGVSNGAHTIKVVAEDTAGRVASRTVNVTVDN